MRRIGEPNRFAIEFSLEPDPHGQWLFGRFNYWVGGSRVGDAQQITSLRDVLFGLDEIAKNATREASRSSETLNGLSAVDIFTRLNNVFFGEPSETERALAVAEGWAKHRALPPVDVFDQFKGFIVEEGVGRFVVNQLGGPVTETTLKVGEFDRIVTEARLQLDEFYSAGRE